MSERLIAKEDVQSVKSWKADSFDDPGLSVARRRLPTATEIEAIERRAYEEGYQSGVGQARQDAQRMAALLQTLSGAIEAMESELADSLLSLSLDLAQQLVRGALAVKPELILPVVREAIGSLSESQQRNVLIVNPSDADIVRQQMADQLARAGWTVAVDETVEPGGCRVESPQGDVDATLAERWKQLLSSLGRSDAWLA